MCPSVDRGLIVGDGNIGNWGFIYFVIFFQISEKKKRGTIPHP